MVGEEVHVKYGFARLKLKDFASKLNLGPVLSSLLPIKVGNTTVAIQNRNVVITGFSNDPTVVSRLVNEIQAKASNS